jgi:hypothetical protein
MVELSPPPVFLDGRKTRQHCSSLRRPPPAQPTISGQLRALEENLGEKLFIRQGRRLVLSDIGQVVYRYARRSSLSAAN